MSDAQVQELQRPQIGRAAELVAKAFRSDPLVNWAVADGAGRHDVVCRMFAKNIRYAWRYGLVHTTPDVNGAAVWLRPGHTDMTLWGMVRAGLLTTPFRLGWRGFRRMRRYNEVKSRLHHELAPGPHWYLLIVAVAPEARGQGLGRSLLQPVLQEADRSGLPCYLETSKEKNLAVFEKLGFTTRSRADTPEAGPPIWAMLRDPR